jgi:ATPases with chaperone activity, ATP-binding subunit
VRQAFKPEFVNRLDDIVSSRRSARPTSVRSCPQRRPAREATGRTPLAVGGHPDARAWLAERGYDPIYGARPLRRLMQHEIDDKLARALLAGEIQDGDTVMVDLKGDELTVKRFAAEDLKPPVADTESA